MQRRDHRVVVKLGTNVITDDMGQPDRRFLRQIADEVVDLMDQGYQVLLVSSGAIGSGMGLMGLTERVREVETRQALAAIGQAHLMGAWEAAFARHGTHVAQLLLTYDALRDRSRFLNVRNATETLLEMGVVPIINENDTVSTEELGDKGEPGASFGDNDKLSAYVASKAQAGLLVLLSDVDGLYTHPPDHPEAELVPVVEEITDVIREMAGSKTGSRLSTGGMPSKLEAASIATQAGIPTVICHGRAPQAVTRVLDGEPLGTRFLAHGSGSEKERWLTIARPQGTIQVDPGAAQALQEGKHLLPAGIIAVQGSFPAGSVVEIRTQDQPVAKAITALSAKQLEVARGKQSDQVREALGIEGQVNVTRKNELVLL